MKTIFTAILVVLTSLPIFNFQIDNLEAQIVPPAYENTAGTTSFLGPLANSPRTYQMLIKSTQLTGLIGMNLNALSFRLPANASADWPVADYSISNYRIYLSESVDPSNRSLTLFSNNAASPQIQVRSGVLNIDSASYKSGSSPNTFGPEITFDQTYLYTGGNLLVEIRQTGFTGTSRSMDAIGTSISGYGTDFSACWKSGDTATFSALQGNFCIIKLSGTPASKLDLTALIEARYNGVTMISDTTLVYLRSDVSPYSIADSSTSILDQNGNGTFYFGNTVSGAFYYVVVNHRNSIETWSASTHLFAGDTLDYDFTTAAASAYGNNQELVGLRWTNFSGDVNKDGAVDLTDLSLVYNDAASFASGYLLTDVNGDLLTDLNDLLEVYENASKFVAVIEP